MPEQTAKTQSNIVLNKQSDLGLKGSELLSISEESIFPVYLLWILYYNFNTSDNQIDWFILHV